MLHSTNIRVVQKARALTIDGKRVQKVNQVVLT